MRMLTKFRSRHADFWRVYHAIAADPSAGTLVIVSNRRVHQGTFAFGAVRELPAVFTVVVAAISALQGEHDAAGHVVAGAELIAGACVLIAKAFEARHLFARHAHHADAARTGTPRLDKSNLAAAALGYVEAWRHARVVAEVQLITPTIVGATLSLLIAFFGNRLFSRRPPVASSRRQLHVAITPNGISYLAGPRRKWRVDWTEVAAVEHGRGELAIRLHDGRRHVLPADDLLGGEHIVAETRAAIAAHAAHVPGAADVARVAAPDARIGVGGQKAAV